MRVICKGNTKSDLPKYYETDYSKEYDFPITIGKSYLVHGLISWEGKIKYLIVGETIEYLLWVPSELFDVEDSKISRYWHYSINIYPHSNLPHVIFGYDELANDLSHYSGLIDGDTTALSILSQYKAKMDLEFPDPEVTKVADAMRDDQTGWWYICPECIEGFQSQSQDALLLCPKCETKLNNPIFSSEL